MTESQATAMRPPPMNWGAFLDQIIRDYNTEPALGLYHGLQKESVQNSYAARDRQSKTPWSCRIRLFKTPKGPILTIVDEGTFGLTGTVFPDSKNLPDTLAPGERLARFESMFDSGGDVGPGLFGRGKLIFNACSENRMIYYDSFTRDGHYRFGIRQFKGRECEQFTQVLEGDPARKRIVEETGGALLPLSTPGTRITIVHPISEVVSAVRKGQLLTAIEDTWWEIIQKDGAAISVSGEDGSDQVAKVPENFGGLPTTNQGKWRVYHVDNQVVPVGETSYKVKHLHLLIPPQGHKLREEQLGVFVQRRGMQVGRLAIAGIPEEISDRFFGYVELDQAWEDAIATCENTTHYGFSHTKRPEFRSLKKWVADHFYAFMENIGYGQKTDPTEIAKQQAEEAQAALNSILNDLGVPSIGSGSENRQGIFVAIENLTFPREDNFVRTGESISGFRFKIENRTSSHQDMAVGVNTHERGVGVIEKLLPSYQMQLGPGETGLTPPLTLLFKGGIYPSGTKIGCTATVTSAEGKELAKRSFFSFLDIPAPTPEPNLADIELLDVEFPREGSKRVDIGQSIRALTYRIDNRTAHRMVLLLKVRTIWAGEGVELDEVFSKEMRLGPFGSANIELEEIRITKEKYEEAGRGKMKLRCTATALESTEAWEKGLRLAEHTTIFYVGMDPAYGLFEDTTFTALGPEAPRSKAIPTAGVKSWRIDINVTHPAYLETGNDRELQTDYLFEESARQTAYVLLSKGQQESMLKVLGLDLHFNVDEMEPEEVLSELAFRFSDRLLAKYYG